MCDALSHAAEFSPSPRSRQPTAGAQGKSGQMNLFDPNVCYKLRSVNVRRCRWVDGSWGILVPCRSSYLGDETAIHHQWWKVIMFRFMNLFSAKSMSLSSPMSTTSEIERGSEWGSLHYYDYYDGLLGSFHEATTLPQDRFGSTSMEFGLHCWWGWNLDGFLVDTYQLPKHQVLALEGCREADYTN